MPLKEPAFKYSMAFDLLIDLKAQLLKITNRKEAAVKNIK